MFHEYENFEELDGFGDYEISPIPPIPPISERKPSRRTRIAASVVDFEDDEIRTPMATEKPKETKKKSEGNQYVNEHMLSVLMSMFRNYDGEAHKSIQFREDFKAQRVKFLKAKEEYLQALVDGNDKRSSRVQTAFMEMLTLSGTVYPNDEEISELFHMIKLISERCIQVYGRNRPIESDDVVSSTFERWLKYRHNFDPLKRSVISGQRVNAFAYMTQIIKNTIFEMVNKHKKQQLLEEKLKGDMFLFESTAPVNPVTPAMQNDADNGENLERGRDFAIEANLDDEESEIIKLLMERVNLHTSMEKLVSDIAEEGYLPDEIISAISTFGLMEPLKDVIAKNKWAF